MISAIVPATDSPPTLDDCLRRLRSELPADAELIVVADEPARGPAAARNEGAGRARGDVLVFVDADVLVAPGTIRAIERRFESDAGLDALFGSYDDRPAAPQAVSAFRNLLHHHVHSGAAGPAETFWAGFGAVRRAAFERAGGFDAERYRRAEIEDIDLGRRLRDSGRRIELDPSLECTHLKRWTLGSMLATDFSRRALPWLRLSLERREIPRTLNASPRHAVAAGGALTGALALIGRRPGALAAGLGVMVAVNLGFYAQLGRAGGVALAGRAVPLHALHHLTALAALPVALAQHLAAGRPRR